MKKKMACALAFLIISASVTPAFAGGRHSYGGHSYGHRHHRNYGPLIGLGLFGLGFGLGRAYDPWRYGERVIIDPRVCAYEPAGYVWNPNWQRWEPASWILVCR